MSLTGTLRANYARLTRRHVFHSIYRKRLWGEDESVSGAGSSLRATVSVRSALPRLLEECKIQSMLDAPCGDFHWLSTCNLPVQHYLGIDIVAELIRINSQNFGSDNRKFACADVIRDRLPRMDLVFCRHLLIHLPLNDCRRVLRNFQQSGAEFLLVTHQPDVVENRDKPMGSFSPVNLTLPPFSLPAPTRIATDCTSAQDKAVLALYKLQELHL